MGCACSSTTSTDKNFSNKNLSNEKLSSAHSDNANIDELNTLNNLLPSYVLKLCNKTGDNKTIFDDQVLERTQTIIIDECLKIKQMLDNFYDENTGKYKIGSSLTAQNLSTILIEINSYLAKLSAIKNDQREKYFKELNIIIPIYRRFGTVIHLNFSTNC